MGKNKSSPIVEPQWIKKLLALANEEGKHPSGPK